MQILMVISFKTVYAFNISNPGTVLLFSIPGAALNPLIQNTKSFMWIIKNWILINAELSGHIYPFSAS